MKERVKDYMAYLEQEEKSKATRRQYERDIFHFLRFAEGQEITRELVLRYKEKLQAEHRPAASMPSWRALNGFFSYLERGDLRVKRLRVQKRPFLSREKELTKAEYLRLLKAAKAQKK